MLTQLHHPQTGLPSYDAAAFSREASVGGVYAGKSGFGALRQLPVMDHTLTEAPSVPTHIVLMFADKSPALLAKVDGAERWKAPPRGSIVLLPAGLASLWDCPPQSGGVVHLHLESQHMDQLLGEPDPQGRITLRPALYERDDTLLEIARGCQNELAAPGPAHHMLMESYGLALAVRLFRGYRVGARVKLGNYTLAPFRLNRVKEYIEANLDRPIDLASMAETAGLSVYHFARAFKQATGNSPHRYLLERRAERARAPARNAPAPDRGGAGLRLRLAAAIHHHVPKAHGQNARSLSTRDPVSPSPRSALAIGS